MALRSYRELKVWQKSMDLVVEVYQVVKKLPREERFELGSQMRRAAVSVPSNIAEGAARSYTPEFIKHLSIASGSLAELETHLLLAQRTGMVNTETTDGCLTRCDEVSRMLSGLDHSLRRRAEHRRREAAGVVDAE